MYADANAGTDAFELIDCFDAGAEDIAVVGLDALG